MGFWVFDVQVLDVFVLFGVISILFLISNSLRRKVPLIRKSLLPTAVIGGILLLIIKELGFLDWLMEDVFRNLFQNESAVHTDINKFMDSITYHSLALGFIAMSLKTTEKMKDRNKQTDIFNSGVLTVTTYLIQGILGLGITMFLSLTLMPGLFAASGILLPLGYGQGSGQALNFGEIFEVQYGFLGGPSFGLTIAAVGLLVACVFGVFHMFLMKRKGLLKNNTDNPVFVSEEVIASPNEVPVTESVDRMSIQIGLVIFVYTITFLFMVGIDQIHIASIQGFLDKTIVPLVYGFNFMVGSIFAVLLKQVFKILKKYNLMSRDYPNNYLLNRLSGFMFDLMIITGIGAIEIKVLKPLIIPLILLCTIGLIVTYFYLRKACYVLFPNYKDEAFLSLFGMLTGTTSTGMILLREVDPKFETPAATNLVYLTFYAIAFGFPLLLLIGYAPKGILPSFITLFILIIMFIAFNMILFRSKFVRKKIKE